MLRVRPYRKEDAKAIVTWSKDEEAFFKWNAGLLGDFPMSVQRMQDATSGRIDNPRYFPFVAVDENRVVGFFTLRHPDETNEELRFGFVIVAPEVRGKGYGKEMLKRGLKFAFEVYGVEKVSLGVFDNNLSAYYCYKSVGFKENGQTEMYRIKNTEWKCVEMEIKGVEK